MRIPVRVAVTVSVAMAAFAPFGLRLQASTPPTLQVPERSALDIARVLAAKYPAQPIMSYIPALSWSGSFRLAALTGEDRWREKPRRDMQAFLSGVTRDASIVARQTASCSTRATMRSIMLTAS